MTCVVDGCDRPPEYGKRGMCRPCYDKQRRFGSGGAVRNAAGADLAQRVTALRLGVEAASARITQALVLLEDPDMIPRTGRFPAELLRDALTELDNARH